MSAAKLRLVFGLVALLIAAALIVALFGYVDLSAQEIWRIVDEHGLGLFVAAFTSLAAQAWFSALKWSSLHVSVLGTQETPRQLGALFFFSALGTFLAQLLPAVLAVTALRATVSRLHLGGSLKQGAAVTVYDQGFDALVLLSAGGACAIVYVAGVGTSAAIPALLLLFAVLTLAARPVFAMMRPLRRFGGLLPRRPTAIGRLARALLLAHGSGLDSPAMAARLISLSILRYLAISGRMLAAVLVLVPGVSIAAAAWGTAVVQSSTVLALTPGNAGVVEWAWAAVGTVIEAPPGLLVATLLALRLVIIPASLLLVLLTLPFLIRTGRHRSTA